MKLIAITGANVTAKMELTVRLAYKLAERNPSLTVLDNSDHPLTLERLSLRRLPTGCVCCTLAGALASAVQQIRTDWILMPVSTLAAPQSLHQVLVGLSGPKLKIRTLAMLDNRTQRRSPYLFEQLSRYADLTITEAVSVDEILRNL